MVNLERNMDALLNLKNKEKKDTQIKYAHIILIHKSLQPLRTIILYFLVFFCPAPRLERFLDVYFFLFFKFVSLGSINVYSIKKNCQILTVVESEGACLHMELRGNDSSNK